MTDNLPEEFLLRMQGLLGDEYPLFLDALGKRKVRGLRINTLKAADTEKPADIPSELLKRIPYNENGYVLESECEVGRSAEHHSGRIYMQDPAAMAPLSAVRLPEGAWVADLCASPGGKSGQAAQMIGESGFLLSNEYVAKRAKILVGNLERLGVRCAVVTNTDTASLAAAYPECFDLVIADAPCSGEGMMRKTEEAGEMWSLENILLCAERQREIIENAAVMVKGGGRLLYSTCTYATEENEAIICAFLRAHPEFFIEEVDPRVKEFTRDGIKYSDDCPDEIRLARRFYPHTAEGEGQFFCVLRKRECDTGARLSFKGAEKPLPREDAAAIKKFFSENFTREPSARLSLVGKNIVLIPHGVPQIPERSVFMSGVLIGEVQKGRLIPSHQLFSAYAELFTRRVELSGQGERMERYLSGEEIEAPPDISDGWCVITYRGAAVGGGKIVSGRIKNHYPKGLRNRRL